MRLTGITPVLNVSDVPASLAWFTALGWHRGFTHNAAGMIAGAADANHAGPAEFASVCCDDVQIFLCHDGQGSRGGPTPRHTHGDDTGGVWMSWWLPTPADVDAAHANALALGVTIAAPPTDEPWGVRECHIVHPDGHTFRLSAPLG
jgi:catechol 2,3-dioxygenase-like lactoylglutathione lyase family enzyme